MSSPHPRDRLAVWGLFAVAVLALGLRVTAIVQPLGIDQSLWASAVRGMSHGQLLYRDVWEQRPPGIYLTYLAAFSALGWREATLVWLDLAASAATAFLIFAIVRTVSTRVTAAAALSVYSVFTMPAWLYGNGGFLERAVCETFTVPCAAVAVWGAARLHAGSRHVTSLLALIGLATGLAVVFKPNAGLYLPAIVLWLACYWRPRPPVRWIGALALLAVSAAAPIVATGVWLWASGVMADATVAIVDFNRFYVSSGVTPDGLALVFAERVFLRMKTDPLWALGCAGAVASVGLLIGRRRLTPVAGLAVAWGGAAILVILVNGIRLFNSYFINAQAPLAVMAAWLVVEAGGTPRGRRAVAALAVGLMLGLAAWRGYVPRVWQSASADLAVMTGSLGRSEYLDRFGVYGNNRGYSARANQELATYIQTRSVPDDRIFLFGINGAGVYFLADRVPAHRFLRVNFFVPDEFPNPAFTLGAVVRDLEAAAPRYVVFERLPTTSDMARLANALPVHPIVQPWLSQYAFETTIEDFTIYRRR